MNRNIALFSIIFIVTALLQVLIFNHIILFNVAIPFVFILFIIRLPINFNLNLLYTLSFLLGLIIDIFSDTPGVNALSSLITAALRRSVFFAYVTRDDRTVEVTPSISELGWGTYMKYLITITAIFCFINFSIEYFSFNSVREILIMTLSSTALSFVIILAADSLLSASKERI